MLIPSIFNRVKWSHVDDIVMSYIAGDFRVRDIDLYKFKVRVQFAKKKIVWWFISRKLINLSLIYLKEIWNFSRNSLFTVSLPGHKIQGPTCSSSFLYRHISFFVSFYWIISFNQSCCSLNKYDKSIIFVTHVCFSWWTTNKVGPMITTTTSFLLIFIERQ